MQARAKKGDFLFAERSLFSAKIMQARAKKGDFPFAERSLFSAKNNASESKERGLSICRA